MRKIDEVAVAKAVGATIAKKRVECGLTQEDVAEKLDIGYEAVSRIERGTVTPNVARLYSLAEIFGCRVDALLLGSTGRTIDQANYIGSLIQGLSEQDRKMLIEIIETLSARMHKKR